MNGFAVFGQAQARRQRHGLWRATGRTPVTAPTNIGACLSNHAPLGADSAHAADVAPVPARDGVVSYPGSPHAGCERSPRRSCRVWRWSRPPIQRTTDKGQGVRQVAYVPADEVTIDAARCTVSGRVRPRQRVCDPQLGPVGKQAVEEHPLRVRRNCLVALSDQIEARAGLPRWHSPSRLRRCSSTAPAGRHTTPWPGRGPRPTRNGRQSPPQAATQSPARPR